MKKVILFGIMTLILSLNALAQTTFTWNTGSGSWTTAANWTKVGGASTSTYPGQNAGQNDLAVIITGVTVTLDASIVTNSVTSLAVNGTGILAMGANNLTLTGAAANVTGTGTITASTGTLTVGGTLSGVTVTASGAATFAVAGAGTAFNPAAYTASTSTVLLNRSGDQTISSSITYNNLTLTSAAAGIKTAAGALTINHDVVLTSANVTFADGGFSHTVANNWGYSAGAPAAVNYTGAGRITFTGSPTFSQNAVFNKVIISGGVKTRTGNTWIVNDSLWVTNSGILQTTANAPITVTGNWLVDNGSQYTATNGTVTFNRAGAQSISMPSGSYFSSIAFSTSGTKTAATALDIRNSFTINSSTIFDPGSFTHLIGTSNGTFTLDGTISSGTSSTFDFRGTTSLTYTVPGPASLPVDVTLTGTITVTNSKAYNVTGNVTIAGAIVLGTSASFNSTGTSKTLTVNAAGNRMYLRGGSFPSGFNTYTISPTATFNYDQATGTTIFATVLDQSAAPITIQYGNLNIGGAVTKTANGNLTVNGALNIAASTTLDLIGNDLTVGTSLVTGSNVLTLNTTGTLTTSVSAGTVTVNATDAAFNVLVGVYTLHNLVFALNTPTVSRAISITGNISVTGNVTVNNTAGSSGITLTLTMGSIATPTAFTGSGASNSFIMNSFTVLSQFQSGTAFGTGFNSFEIQTLDAFSTISFASTNNQTVPVLVGGDYGAISFAGNASTKTFGGSVILNGNLTLTNATFIINDGGNTITVNGNFNKQGANPTMSLTGTISFEGGTQSITLTGGGAFNNVVFSGNGVKSILTAITISGDLNITIASTVTTALGVTFRGVNWQNDGLFQQTAGTTTFKGTTSGTHQNIYSPGSFDNSASYFSSVTLDTAGAYLIPTTQVDSTILLSDIDIDGTLTLTASSAILNATNQLIRIGTNWSRGAATSFVNTGSTVIFDGNSAQTILALSLPFNNVTFQNAGPKAMSGNNTPLLVDGNLSIEGGASFNAGTSAGHTITGNWSNVGTYTASGTLTFNGAAQSLEGTFGSVVFSGSGTKTLTSSISVSAITISNGVTLDVSGSNYAIAVTGIWTNSGSGAFLPQNGLVTFSGSNRTINPGAGKSFYDLSINMTSGQTLTIGAGNAISVDNDFNIIQGTFSSGANNMTIGGNFINAGTFTHNTASTITFTATTGTKTFTTGGSNILGPMVFATGSSAIYNLGSNLTTGNVLSKITLNGSSGTLKLNGKALNMSTSAVATIDIAGGTFHVDSAAVLSMPTNGVINNTGGTLRIVGVSGYVATVQGTATGYTISQSGATSVIAANYFIIQELRSTGITLSNGSIDPTDNFSNGTFNDGRTATQYLNISALTLNSNITASNTVFNSGATFNVTRSAINGTGNLIFNDATGPLSGESFDSDAANGIQWTYVGGITWDNGGGDNDWNTGLNWSSNSVPGASDYVILDHSVIAGTYTVNISSADAQCGNLVIGPGGAFPITLALSGNYDLVVNGDLNINTAGVLSQANSGSTITVANSWANLGTYTANSSTITFNGASVSKTITNSGAGNFYNLIINGTGSTYTLGSNLTVANDFTITSGTFDVSGSNFTLGVTGNWSVSGTFNPRTSTVTFNKAGAQSISGGTFYNFTTSGSGTKSITSNLDINNQVTIGLGTVLDGGTNTIYVGGSTAAVWVNSAGTAAFTQTGAGVVEFDGGNITLDNGAFATTFNNINFAGTGTKTFGGTGSTINGNMSIAAGGIVVNLATVALNFAGTNTLSILGNSTLQVRQTNLPASLETLSLNSASTVLYISDSPQNIFPGTYGNLQIQRITAGQTPSKSLLGTTVVAGNLALNDAEVRFDIAGQYLTVTGTLTIPTNASNFNTNLTGSTLELNGTANINIDADLTTVNNLVLSGSGTKTILGPLSVLGDLQVGSGVTFSTGAFVVTGTGTKTLSLASSALLNTAVDGATPLPTGFGSYAFNATSTVTYNSNTGSQTIRSTVLYGNLSLSNGNGTKTANGNLDINGTFTVNNAVVFDAGSNTYNIAGDMVINSGATINPQTSTFIFDGITQAIGITNNNGAFTIPFYNLTASNSGTLTLSSTAGDVMTVAGDLTVSVGGVVTTARALTVTGNFTNNNTFIMSGSTLTFNGNSQTINPGPNNSFNAITFLSASAGTSSKTFSTYGADINGAITLGANLDVTNLVNWVMGAGLNYTIAGTITLNASNVWTPTGSNISFDGAGVTLPTQAISANNLTMAGTGTKTMGGNWSINDLTINSGVTLTTTVTNYSITSTGNWTNNGTFTANSSTVAFESNNTTGKTIQTGASAFYDVTFNQSLTSARTYTLASATTTINRNLTIGTNATLDANSKILVAGSNAAASSVSVAGTLEIDNGAFLRFNNTAAGSSLSVNTGGVLRILGTSSSSVGTISRSAGANRTTVGISSGGTLAAQYYLIEYVSDAGVVLNSGSTLDNTNNLSNGTWSNISANAGARYLQIDNNVGTQSINNVTFNCVPAPVAQINVARTGAATGAITFGGTIDGALAGLNATINSTYESDPSSTMTWPLSTAATWTGTTSTDWNVSTNWSTGIVPDGTIDVTVPDVTNDPKITSFDATAKSLTITNGTLILENGYDLTVVQDLNLGTAANTAILSVTNSSNLITVGGSWTRGTNGTFGNGSSTVYFNGSSGTKTIDNRASSFYNLEFTGAAVFNIASTGAVIDINGALTVGATSTVFMTINNYNLTLAGSFINNGSFNPTSTGVVGTVTLDGAAQNITGGNFYNLTVSGTGVKSTTNNATVNNTLTVNSTFTAGDTLDLNGAVSIAVAGQLNDGGFSHTFAGATWTNSNTTNGYAGTGTVVFDGANQTINASQFYNLTLSGTGNKVLGGNLTVNGDLVADATITYLNVVTFLITGQAGKSFTFNAPNLYIRGVNNFPTAFGTYTISSGTTTNYDAAFDQTIAGNIVYGPITLANASTKTLSGPISVVGALNFAAATLDVSASNYSITITGNWNNNSTGSFVPRLGDVIFAGSVAQSINNGNSGTKPFYKLTVSNTGGATVSIANANNASCTFNLLVTEGYFSANTFTMTVGGSLTASGTGGFAQSGTIILSTSSGSFDVSTNVVSVPTSGFNNLTINSTGVTYTAQDNILINNNLTLTAGTFTGNGKYITIGANGGGAKTATIAGTYIIGANGTLALGNTNLTVNSGGEIRVVGTSGNPAFVTRNGTGTYGFQVNGTIQANYATFEYMNGSGINVTTTATVHATNNFSNCTFTNGTAAGVMLKLENSTAGFTITDASFPSNPGGGAYNVQRTQVSGIIVFNPSSGSFTGESFDNDPNNMVSWPTPITLTWRSDAPTTDWFTASNWTPSSGGSIIPDTTTNVIIVSSVNAPIINASGAKTNNLTLTSGSLTINTGGGGSTTDLKIFGDAALNGGTFTVTSNVDRVDVGGNWTKGASATFSNGSSTITFIALSGSKTINNGSTAFYNLVLNTAATYSLGVNTTINNDLTITSGTLDVSGTVYNLTVGGNWSNTGTFTSRTGTVTFNQTSASTKTINSGGSSFNNLTFNLGASTIYQLSTSSLTTKGNTTISAGTLDLNGLIFNHGDGTGVDAISITGVLSVDSTSFLNMGANSTLTVNSGGTISILGTSSSYIATVSHQTAGTYSFTVSSGGTIAARYYLMQDMDVNGILLNAGALINASNYFQDGTFSNGTAGGTYLNLGNTLSGQLVTGVTFNSGPTYNVTRGNGLTGSITFQDTNGALAGSAYENDINNQVAFTTTIPARTWKTNTSGSSEWNLASNWVEGIIPTTSENVTIPAGVTTNPIISTAHAFARNLSILGTSTLQVTGGFNLTVSGDVSIVGTLTHNGAASIIYVAGNWTRTGTFTVGNNSTVEFNGTSGTKVISNGATAFRNVIINGAATFTPAANMTTSLSFTLTAGTFDVTASNYSLTVGGDWTNNGGTFNPRSGTVTLNGTSTQNIVTGGTGAGKYFYTLAISKSSGTANVITNDLLVTRNLNITLGTLNGGSRTISVYNNWNNSGGTFTPSTGTVSFESTGAKTLAANTSSFNNLIINKTSGGSISLSSNITVLGNLTVTAGTLFSNSKAINFGDAGSDVTSVASGATLDIDAGSFLRLFGGTNSTVAGTLKLIGTSGSNLATMTRYTSGNYSLTINGTMHAKFATIEYTGTNAGTDGITFGSTGNVDATNNFVSTTFQNGSGNAYLTLNSNNSFNLASSVTTGPTFTAGPTYNVQKSSGTGTHIINNYKGAFSGARFENDNGTVPRGNIRWLFTETQNIAGVGSYTFGNDFIINVTSGSLGSTTVSLNDSIVSPLYPASMARYYTVSGASGPFVADITQYWGANDINGQTANNTPNANPLRLWRRVVSGNVLTPFVSDSVNSSVKLARKNAFSFVSDGSINGQWFLSNAATESSLPVELDEKSIELTAQRTGIEFKWATQSELNNKFWEVERSEKGKDQFSVIGRLEGKGTTSEKTNYRYMDKSAEVAKTYLYRLVDYDYAGNKFTHKSYEIDYVQPKEFMIGHNYPNPFNPTTTIPVDIAKEQQVSMIIYNILGQEIRVVKNEVMKPGYYNLQWDGKDNAGKTAASGQYFVRVVTEGFVKTQKMMLMK